MSLLLQMSEILGQVKWMDGTDNIAFQGDDQIVLSRLSKGLYRQKSDDPGGERERKEHLAIAELLVNLVKKAEAQGEKWPLSGDLAKMILAPDNRGRIIGAHVVAVLASVNALLPDSFSDSFFVPSDDSNGSTDVRQFDQWVRKRA